MERLTDSPGEFLNEKIAHSEDGDTRVFFQIKQMMIARHNAGRFDCDGAAQENIIIRIGSHDDGALLRDIEDGSQVYCISEQFGGGESQLFQAGLELLISKYLGQFLDHRRCEAQLNLSFFSQAQ